MIVMQSPRKCDTATPIRHARPPVLSAKRQGRNFRAGESALLWALAAIPCTSPLQSPLLGMTGAGPFFQIRCRCQEKKYMLYPRIPRKTPFFRRLRPRLKSRTREGVTDLCRVLHWRAKIHAPNLPLLLLKDSDTNSSSSSPTRPKESPRGYSTNRGRLPSSDSPSCEVPTPQPGCFLWSAPNPR